MLVYREGRRTIDLLVRARSLRAAAGSGDALDLVLRAGELECALADLDDPAHASLAAITDHAADALVTGRPLDVSTLAGLDQMPQRSARVSEPEGFAYYGVHPLDYAAAITVAVPSDASAWIVGIRTIGSVLSAVARAALRARGQDAERDTVRPGGHPFDRTLEPTPALRARAERAARRGSIVAIVDEGPGQSGSSFLAVADALESAGVRRDRIVLIPSHEPDLARLVARDAARRWSSLRRVVASPTRARPASAREEISAGTWRARFLGDPRAWPATWPATERRKYLLDSGELAKLEGLGPAANAARERAEALWDAGVGPKARWLDDGFVAYERVPGRPMARGARPPIALIARRIALAPPAAPAEDALLAIEHMTTTNIAALLGRDVRTTLALGRPAIVDGRLAPHEWIASASAIVKTDGITHGDDHFFPGPCDIAWDLAGAIVEWELDRHHSRALIDAYVAESGDRDVRARLPGWALAYVALRAAWLATARGACDATPEAARLAREAERMRMRLGAMLSRRG